MSHVISVDIPSLQAVAGQIEAAGAALAKLPAPSSEPALAALDRTGAAWVGYLTALGGRISSIGVDLRAVADGYAGAEAAARVELRRPSR